MPKRRSIIKTPKLKPTPVTQPRAAPPSTSPELAMDFVEMCLLWSRLASALARDSGSPGTSNERRSTGGAKAAPSMINNEVFDAAVIIETGVRSIEAQVVRVLSDDPIDRSVDQALALFLGWHTRLLNKPGAGPLARTMERDVRSWMVAARRAIGLRRQDVRMDLLCPHHRTEAPTRLRITGSEATLNPSMLRGRPTVPPSPTIGPTCGTRICVHDSCSWVRLRTSLPANKDWQWVAGQWVWVSTTEQRPYEFRDAKTIRCPHCGVIWQGRARRVLAQMLRAAGDQLTGDVTEHLL